MLGHPTKNCYVFKDNLQALIDAEVLKLRPEQKKVMANMTSFLQFRKQAPAPPGVVPIPKEELRMINTDPHHQQEKGLVSIPTPQGKIMWVHPDLVDGQQWTTVTSRRSKGKAKASSCNVVCTSSRKMETDVPSLTDSEEKTIVLAAELNKPLVTETRSGQSYLKKYDKIVASPLNLLQSRLSPPRSNRWRSRKSFDFLRFSQRTMRKDPQHPTTLTSWLN